MAMLENLALQKGKMKAKYLKHYFPTHYVIRKENLTILKDVKIFFFYKQPFLFFCVF